MSGKFRDYPTDKLKSRKGGLWPSEIFQISEDLIPEMRSISRKQILLLPVCRQAGLSADKAGKIWVNTFGLSVDGRSLN